MSYCLVPDTYHFRYCEIVVHALTPCTKNPFYNNTFFFLMTYLYYISTSPYHHYSYKCDHIVHPVHWLRFKEIRMSDLLCAKFLDFLYHAAW